MIAIDCAFAEPRMVRSDNDHLCADLQAGSVPSYAAQLMRTSHQQIAYRFERFALIAMAIANPIGMPGEGSGTASSCEKAAAPWAETYELLNRAKSA